MITNDKSLIKGNPMELQTYIELMQEKLSAYFDIEVPFEYKNRQFDLYARSDLRNERYFASKKIKVYAIENKEHVFIKACDQLTERELDDFWQALVTASEEFPQPHDEHMSTIINGILLTTEPVSPELQKSVQKMKQEKSFAFGLKGWVYVRLIVLNLHDHSMIHNRRGKEVIELYGLK
jgi:hypothetical protein